MRITLLFSLLFILIPASSYAVEEQPETWYQVEVLAFKHVDNKAIASESWPVSPDLPSLDNIIEVQSGNVANPYYTELSESEFTLKNEANGLNKQPNYEVLLHIAWKQPILHKSQTSPIHLTGGKPLDEYSNRRYSSEITQNELNGTITLSQAKYINVQANLVLNSPAGELFGQSVFDELTGFGGIESFTLVQSRRMRPKETHYFDHPLFGMLVRVTPIETL